MKPQSSPVLTKEGLLLAIDGEGGFLPRYPQVPLGLMQDLDVKTMLVEARKRLEGALAYLKKGKYTLNPDLERYKVWLESLPV